MQLPALEKLLLTNEELDVARKQIEEMAYFKWQNAGCPEEDSAKFWSEAEIDWIEYCYVPDRFVPADKTSPDN